jgi:hypothetical protein
VTTKELIKTMRFKLGYEVRTERHVMDGFPPMVIRSAYTSKGEYIGSPRFARSLYKRGIVPQLRKRESRVCSIGFNEKEQKWYGWSHRAICGFGIGDKVFIERFGNDKTPFVKHGRRDIKNMKDAKLAASRFAASVS